MIINQQQLKYTVYLTDWDNGNTAVHHCSAFNPQSAELSAEAWALSYLGLALEAKFIVNGWHTNLLGHSFSEPHKQVRKKQIASQESKK